MLLYSKTILSFTNKIKNKAHRIMKEEMGLDVRRSRFFWRGYLYPLHFVIFEDPNKLGYFNSHAYQIGLHKKLMYLAKDEVIENILRHELAHFYTFLLYGKQFNELLPHGQEFQAVCRQFLWGSEVSLAYSNLEKDNLKAAEDPDFERVTSKIKKLLALSSSDNPHEAEMATVKANQLLIEHNLKNLHLSEEALEDEEVVVLSVYEAPKSNAMMNALYDILQHFYVQPVINRNNEGVHLDVVGSKLNTSLALQVSDFIQDEFQRLWEKTRKENPRLKGLRAKNSYTLGLAKGFSSKLKASKDVMKAQAQGKELVLLEKKLLSQLQIAFPRLSRQKGSSGTYHPDALSLGQRHGKDINFKGANKSKESTNSKVLQISFS